MCTGPVVNIGLGGAPQYSMKDTHLAPASLSSGHLENSKATTPTPTLGG